MHHPLVVNHLLYFWDNWPAMSDRNALIVHTEPDSDGFKVKDLTSQLDLSHTCTSTSLVLVNLIKLEYPQLQLTVSFLDIFYNHLHNYNTSHAINLSVYTV